MMRTRKSWLGALALALPGLACDGGTQTPADAYVAPAVASVSPTPVFEGLQRIAVDFSGADFTGVTAPPTIEATSGTPPRGSDLEITDWLCNNVRCGLALRLGKWLPGHTQPLPSSILGQQLRFFFQGATNQIAGTLLVLPLNPGGAGATSTALHLAGTYMFSRFEMGAGVQLIVDPATDGMPGRLFVTGDVTLGDGAVIDASGLPGTGDPAAGGLGGPGGFPGAAGGANAALPMGGSAGTAPGGGGGGGGFGEPGESGDGVPDVDVGGAAGTAGQSPALDCLRATGTGCGGGGGGSAGSGEGGGGGAGGVMLVSLGTARIAGATLRSNGGAGADGVDGSGGGGGAGGAVGLGAVRLEGTGTLETAGGSGGAAGASGAAGGAGGDGRVRVEAAQASTSTVTAGTSYGGPAVDLEALDVVTRDAETTLRGRAEAGATIRIRNWSVHPAQLSEGTVAADGSFAVAVPLLAGLNDLEVAQRVGTDEARSWTGTMFELSGRTVLGARIYVVRVPEVE
jgi:hypothetical protein